MTRPHPALSVRGLDVDLAGRAVLRGVDLTVQRGEVVAVLGANGSGKSTLIRAAVGLVPFQAGSVDLLGTPLSDFRDRHRLGYVPQRSAGVAGVPATVREVVLSGRLSRRRFAGPARRVDREAVDRAIEHVGLTDHRRRAVTELSGGQHQRVLIARALACEPELLVMDEPLAGVDSASGARLAEVVGDLVATGGTVVLVEHELGPLRPVVDRAVVVHHGRVVHDAPADDPHVHAAHTERHTHPHSAEPARLEPFPGEGAL